MADRIEPWKLIALLVRNNVNFPGSEGCKPWKASIYFHGSEYNENKYADRNLVSLNIHKFYSPGFTFFLFANAKLFLFSNYCYWPTKILLYQVQSFRHRTQFSVFMKDIGFHGCLTMSIQYHKPYPIQMINNIVFLCVIFYHCNINIASSL